MLRAGLRLLFFSWFPVQGTSRFTVQGAAALHRAPRRRPPYSAGGTGVRSRPGEEIARRRHLVPAGVPREAEVGRRRRLVEQEVADGDLPFLPVLHDGPVDEGDEAFHGR